MKKSLILILIGFIYACGSSYEKNAEESLALENEMAPMEESYEAEETEKYSTKSIVAPSQQKRSKTQATPDNKTGNFRNPLEYLSDTLYLKSVRLSKKFIKTADLKFKVKNVEETTINIEKLVLKLGGYIQQSQIRSNYLNSRNIEISKDTIKEVFEYYVSNEMIVRVPRIYFDNVLSEIAKEQVYLDHRNVKTEDVSTVFLRNKLKEEKRTEYEKRIQRAVDKAPRRLDDIVMAEKEASDLADIAIDKKIDNYNLQDRIDFSTISLSIYQSNSLHEENVENTRLIEFKPNFWQRAWKALQTGWLVILEIFIGLLYIWPLYLIAIGVIYLIKYLKRRKKL